MIKFNLDLTEDKANADISGTPEQLVELIATIMIKNDMCAKIILASADVYENCIKE